MNQRAVVRTTAVPSDRMKPLADVVEAGTDFFIEDIAITAIVFDSADDDATLWGTTVVDEELHFFHLALSFGDLSTLLRLAGERNPALDEEVAEALSAERLTNAEGEIEPSVLEFITDERPPILLPGIAMKLAFTYTDETNEEMAYNIFALEGIYVRLP